MVKSKQAFTLVTDYWCFFRRVEMSATVQFVAAVLRAILKTISTFHVSYNVSYNDSSQKFTQFKEAGVS